MKKFLVLAVLALGLSLGFAANGEQVYQTYCMSCHQANGKGLPGAFPPLVGVVPQVIAKNRTLPIDVVLFGIQGKLEIDSAIYNGVMPPFGNQLKDDQVAAVLNYIAKAWGNDKLLPKDFKPYQAAEVQKERGKKLTAQQVYELWMKVMSK